MTDLLSNLPRIPFYGYYAEPEDVEQYPYSSKYLQSLNEHKIEGYQLYKSINKIQDWLDEYVKRDGQKNYQWTKADSFLIVWYDINESLHLCSEIRFRFQDDLLAFKLKFTISL
jgi:hypothetical protein